MNNYIAGSYAPSLTTGLEPAPSPTPTPSPSVMSPMLRYGGWSALMARTAIENAAAASVTGGGAGTIVAVEPRTVALLAASEAAATGGPGMADAQTVNTLRAEGGLLIPEEFKKFLPLILLFLLFALVIFKK